MLLAWKIGIIFDGRLVNDMLEEAIATHGENEHPIVHADKGCRCRWPGRIGLMKEAGLQRSM
jgi:putative transposase